MCCFHIFLSFFLYPELFALALTCSLDQRFSAKNFVNMAEGDKFGWNWFKQEPFWGFSLILS